MADFLPAKQPALILQILHVHWQHSPHRHDITRSSRSIRAFEATPNDHAIPRQSTPIEIAIKHPMGRNPKGRTELRLRVQNVQILLSLAATLENAICEAYETKISTQWRQSLQMGL